MRRANPDMMVPALKKVDRPKKGKDWPSLTRTKHREQDALADIERTKPGSAQLH